MPGRDTELQPDGSGSLKCFGLHSWLGGEKGLVKCRYWAKAHIVNFKRPSKTDFAKGLWLLLQVLV